MTTGLMAAHGRPHELVCPHRARGGSLSSFRRGLAPLQERTMSIYVGFVLLALMGILAYGVSFDIRRALEERRWRKDQKHAQEVLDAAEHAWAVREARKMGAFADQLQEIRRLPTYVSGNWKEMR